MARCGGLKLAKSQPVEKRSEWLTGVRWANQAGRFLREIQEWPRTVAEVDLRLCRPLAELVAADWIAVQLHPLARQSRPSEAPVGVESSLASLMTRMDSQRTGDYRMEECWVDGHLLVYVPILAEVQGRTALLGWIAAALARPEKGQDGAALVARQELLAEFGLHLEHLATESDLRSQIRTRDQFLSIASHELKTPLTSIYGILQLQERMMKTMGWPLEMRPEQERQLSFLRLVLRQTERMTELIDGLLDVSRIQAGRFSVEPMVSEVGRLVQDVVRGRIEILAREAGVQVLVEAPESQAAWVDPTRFEEVVTNLAMNALRMSPEGGVVWLRLRPEGNDVVLSIRDQGQVLSAEDRLRVFEPFERARVVAKMGGLGLGLYISRQIARLHGGDVVLLPAAAGRGNVFEARFPASAPSA